ncbi:hypothetical protein ACIFOT_14695 [Neobacillus sp. NRS-1170]|uniref:hypothetical protein n=1 Tax=Neobacillus sp. NRS-1170 TaxID=3233898 RepID=UPI003D2664E0
MDLGKLCSEELQKLTGGHFLNEDLYFSLEDLKILLKIIENLNCVDDLVISPFHLAEDSTMEAYWCTLSIKIVDVVQDKNIVLLSETGKSNLAEIEEQYIELWDNTYYEILKNDLSGLIKSLKRYISFMENREVSLREEYDMPDKKWQGIYYQIY